MKSEETSKVQESGAAGILSKVTNLKSIKETLENGKNNLQKASVRAKENISKTFHKRAEETNEFIDSVKNKNAKIKNLESMLGLDKSLLVSSDKTTSFYKYSKDRIIIFDKDVLGNPCGVTIKENSKVHIFIVKYIDYKPFLFPSYDEKDITGEIIYMDTEEIWFRDMNKLTLGYNNGSGMEFRTVKASELLGLTDENLIPYIKKYSSIIRSPKLTKVFNENCLEINNILKLSDDYLIYKNKEKGYTIFLYSYANKCFNEINLEKLPNIQFSSYDTLLAPDILRFIKENNYPIEQFEEKNGYIEYNKEVGRAKVSVMRFKI